MWDHQWMRENNTVVWTIQKSMPNMGFFFFLHQFPQIKLTSNSVPSQFIMDDSLQWKNDELGLLPLDALRSIVLDEIHLLVPELMWLWSFCLSSMKVRMIYRCSCRMGKDSKRPVFQKAKRRILICHLHCWKRTSWNSFSNVAKIRRQWPVWRGRWHHLQICRQCEMVGSDWHTQWQSFSPEESAGSWRLDQDKMHGIKQEEMQGPTAQAE